MSFVERVSLKREQLAESDKRTLIGAGLIIPSILLIAVTIVYPFLNALQISLYDLGASEFVGLGNYTWLLTQGSFWSFIFNSVVWTVGNIVLQGAVGIALALLLNQYFFGREVVRTVILIPFILPTAVTAVMWRWMLNATYGPINHYLLEIGLLSQSFNPLGSPTYALTTVTLINTWRWAPLVALVVFAVLQTIPEEEYEAARMEGAGILQEFYHVTYPHLQSSLTILGLLGVLLTFNIFDMVWLLTQGGPVGATTTLPVFIYDVAFNRQNIGRATAMSVVLFMMLVVFVIAYFQQEQFRESDL